MANRGHYDRIRRARAMGLLNVKVAVITGASRGWRRPPPGPWSEREPGWSPATSAATSFPEMSEKSALKRAGQPHEVAEMAAFVVSDRAPFVTKPRSASTAVRPPNRLRGRVR
jgi:NAD(P)-dependent dehydrogenase (short-subunit alcohol dehydrogenase family)